MYQKTQKSWLKHLDFLLLDLICLELAYALSFELRYLLYRGETENFWQMNPWSSTLHRQVSILLVVAHLFFAVTSSVYKDILRRGYFQELKHVVVHNTLVVVALVVYLYATKAGEQFSRASYMFTWLCGILFMFFVHLLWKRFLRKRMENDSSIPNVLVVVSAQRAETVLNRISKQHYNGFRLAGVAILEENRIGDEICGIQVVADGKSMYDYVLENVVDSVLLSDILPEEQQNYAYRFLSMGQTVHIDLNRDEEIYPNQIVEKMGDLTVLTSSIKAVDGVQLAMKRIMDILGGLAGTVLVLIAAIILFPVVKLQAPGPLFFTQTRVGKNGRKFKIYKFRSMYIDAEERKAELMQQNEMQGFMFKMENDPRIFPAGHFIRRFSIDELPQFINILKGDMSLVGTRPPTVEEYEQYELHHKVRLSIKPGLTGLWQVSGRSEIKDFEEVVKLDEQYIREWSLALDFKLLLKTVQVVFCAKGAM